MYGDGLNIDAMNTLLNQIQLAGVIGMVLIIVFPIDIRKSDIKLVLELQRI